VPDAIENIVDALIPDNVEAKMDNAARTAAGAHLLRPGCGE
jgi:hypothetical protein